MKKTPTPIEIKMSALCKRDFKTNEDWKQANV